MAEQLPMKPDSPRVLTPAAMDLDSSGWVPSCLAYLAWLPGCLAAWLPGCLGCLGCLGCSPGLLPRRWTGWGSQATSGRASACKDDLLEGGGTEGPEYRELIGSREKRAASPLKAVRVLGPGPDPLPSCSSRYPLGLVPV